MNNMNVLKDTTDIWFTAYLMYRGLKISKYEKLTSRGKVRCFFEVTEEDWQKYKLEFNNSEFVKFKGLIEQIKDLGF